jgi:lysozyme
MNYDRSRFENEVKEREALRLKLYKDTTGHLTIGWGHNIQDKGISLEIAQLILDEDIAEAEDELERNFTWVNDLDPVRQAALLDMMFNMGTPALKKFKRSLGFIRTGKYKEAGISLRQTLWYKQVGQRAERVIRMIETGE